MYQLSVKGPRMLLPATLLVLAVVLPPVSYAQEASATAAPQPGTYCPDQASLYLILEELTVGLQSVAKAKESLLVLEDAPTAETLLARAGAALALAVGRGSGARVATLIDAAMAAKKDGNPKAMLLWFPTLKLALSGLPPDVTREAAEEQIASAEGIVQGQAEGDEIQTLLKARQLLVCDPLDIPLQQSLTRLSRLQRSISRGDKPSADDFSALIGLLSRAMNYGLQRLVALEQRP